ncbi:site-2 protease family protein [Xanthomonas albilineans]|uniref:site-2 protease family protein n=1 Tax=Xanthomonas albilineans TaxID=29447 RepID=UPI0027D96FAF|nr:site-2 protease family protein [Xanthomonas albilineans]
MTHAESSSSGGPSAGPFPSRLAIHLGDRPAYSSDEGLSCSELLPAVRPNVVVGPLQIIGGKPSHFVRLQAGSGYLRIGEREAFLLSVLNGQRSADEVCAAYQECFGRVLTRASLEAALALFARHGLVQAPGAAPPAGTSTLPPLRENTVLSYRLMQGDPHRFIGRLLPWLGGLCNGWVMLMWGLALVSAQVVLLPHAAELWQQLAGAPRQTWLPRLGVQLAVIFLVTVLHETGHALACRRFGGEVHEMGLMVRYFLLCAYTRVDDMLLLHSRRQRLQVLLMGPLVSLSVVPLALAGWSVLPRDGLTSLVMADLLVFYNLVCLLQFLPYLQSDGYFMLAQALRMPELRKDAGAWLAQQLLARLLRRTPATLPPEAPSHVPRVYAAYGITAFVITPLAVVLVLAQYGLTFYELLGPLPAVALGVVLLALAAWRLYADYAPWWATQIARLPPAVRKE